MKSINIKVYLGDFVTKSNTAVYDWKGLSLQTLKDAICYFEIAHWFKHGCGFDDVRRIWYKRKG